MSNHWLNKEIYIQDTDVWKRMAEKTIYEYNQFKLWEAKFFAICKRKNFNSKTSWLCRRIYFDAGWKPIAAVNGLRRNNE